MTSILERAIEYARAVFEKDFSGHDWFHTERVLHLASRLAAEEGADLLTVQLAAVLHDVDDRKLSPQTAANKDNARRFLLHEHCSEAFIESIIRIIDEVAFRGTDSVVPDSIEGKCVQDADRLDAIGAIGAARAFAYGGSHGRAMHDPDILPQAGMDRQKYYHSESTSLNHFYEKLFLLKDMMNTESGKAIALQRDRFLHAFEEEFLAEWAGER